MREIILGYKKKTFSSFPQTPLHWAAYKRSVECVNALIKHGADVSTKDVRSERVCGSASQEEIWGNLCELLTDDCLGVGVATYADCGKITILISLLYFLDHFFSYFSSSNVSFTVPNSVNLRVYMSVRISENHGTCVGLCVCECD